MPVRIRAIWLIATCALWPGTLLGQVLFTETFNDGLAGTRWFVREEGDNDTPDISVQLNFNYSTLGIPSAPRGTGTTGGKLDSNMSGLGGAEAVNIFPTGQSFSGDYVLRFDVWARVAGDPTNSAEDFLAGINTTGTRTNWLSIGSTGSDGVFHGVTGNGGNTGGFDYVRYVGNTSGDPQILPLSDNTGAIPQSTFPTSAGTPENQWVSVDIEQINGMAALRLNGVTFDQFVNASGFTTGNIFLGHQDVIATALGNPLTFSLFDNVSVARIARWTTDADASWTTPSNWSVVPLSAPDTVVYFGDLITAQRTINVPTTQAMGSLVLDSLLSYSFTGTGAIVLSATSGEASIDVRRGTHAILAPVVLATNTRIDVAQSINSLILLTDPIVIPGVSLLKTGAGTLQLTRVRVNGLTVQDGTIRIAPRAQNNDPAATSVVQSLSIAGPPGAPTASLDLANTSLIIDHSGVFSTSTLRQWLRNGLLGGEGLISSTLSSTRRLGYFDNASGAYTTFAGQPVDPTTMLISFTFAGDANLDGRVDVRDLRLLATHWLSMGFWMDGDFNYDGVINAMDLGILSQNWQAGTQTVISPLSEGVTTDSVPEPGGILCAVAVMLCPMRRKNGPYLTRGSHAVG